MICPDHTFVVAGYGESPHLRECLRSLKAQSVKSRIIIASSLDSDYLRGIAAKEGVDYSVNPVRLGIACDWSFAYAAASTKYVTIAHQDDIYMSDYTLSCLEAARPLGDELIVFTDYGEIREKRSALSFINGLVKKTLLWPFLFKCGIGSVFLKRLSVSFGNPICCPSVMYNRENLGEMRFNESFSVSLDWHKWVELSMIEGSFVFVRKKLMLHRIHSGSASTATINANIRAREDLRIFRQIWPGMIAGLFGAVYGISSRSTAVSDGDIDG